MTQRVIILLSLLLISIVSIAQIDSVTKTKKVFGFAFPEVFHVGLSLDVSPYNQIGFSAGFVPLAFESAFGISAEHRLYFGKVKSTALRRQWFSRQGFSIRSDREKGGIATFTFGKDFTKVAKHGWTADVGIQIPTHKEPSDRDFYAALRVQYFVYFTKKNKVREP